MGLIPGRSSSHILSITSITLIPLIPLHYRKSLRSDCSPLELPESGVDNLNTLLALDVEDMDEFLEDMSLRHRNLIKKSIKEENDF
jgi:hypothetical protein